MPMLNKELLSSSFKFPEDLKISNNHSLPEKVLQFGEGNFLRGFADWMFNRLNQNNFFNGSIVVVQPIEQGSLDNFSNQDNLYTLLLRGIKDKETVNSKEIISSISRTINPYKNYDDYLKCAENPDLRVIISNTTEAGISYNPDDRFYSTPPASFPAKLAVFLYNRFKVFNGDNSKGFIILPCELIDRNGDTLKSIILRLADEWNLGNDFILWIENANYFLNTLVDRIVTGYPKDEIQKLIPELGYEDKLMNTAEIFHLWVIEGDSRLAEELPFEKAGLNVIWTNSLTPYRTRKVRILNGAHTMTVLAAYLCGLNTVKQCMEDEVIYSFMKKGIFDEIVPILDLPRNELKRYAEDVLERFSNPFIQHFLLSISLNSTSKFKTRVLPSMLEYFRTNKKLPKTLTFSLAALIAFYRGTEIKGASLIGERASNQYSITDDLHVLEIFKQQWLNFNQNGGKVEELVYNVLNRDDIWGMNLNELDGFTSSVATYLGSILSKGVKETIKEIVR